MTTKPAAATFHDKHITMAHGAGGEAARRLIEGLIATTFSNPVLDKLSDAAVLPPIDGTLCFTSDSFVVRPLEFPGGSIGELAINGTVNDLAVSGAFPVALTANFILEAGLDCEVLRRTVHAMAVAARHANVPVVGGDTKVVEHGMADGMYIATSGIGILHPAARLGPQFVQPGDHVLVSGPIGAHGITIMLARAELELAADVQSDTRPLTCFTRGLLDRLGPGIRWMRDATRGGVATVLNELARDAGVLVVIEEESIPVADVVRGACEILGLDPLHVANEGQFLAVVAGTQVELGLETLRSIPGGEGACRIGQIETSTFPRVIAKASYGGKRVIDMLIGDPLPRIC